MQELIDKIPPQVVPYLQNILIALAIFIIGKCAARIITFIIGKVMEKGKSHKALVSFIKSLVYYVILMFVIIAALKKVGLETSSLVALIGAAGLAIGFALQGSLANFAAGVMIIAFRLFDVGNTIETAGTKGKVEEIQMFNTILSVDNAKVIMPNSKITADKITILS